MAGKKALKPETEVKDIITTEASATPAETATTPVADAAPKARKKPGPKPGTPRKPRTPKAPAKAETGVAADVKDTAVADKAPAAKAPKAAKKPAAKAAKAPKVAKKPAVKKPAAKAAKPAKATAAKPAKAAKAAAPKAAKPAKAAAPKAVKAPKTTAKKETAVDTKPAVKRGGAKKKELTINDFVNKTRAVYGKKSVSKKLPVLPVNIMLHGAFKGTFYILIKDGKIEVEPYRYDNLPVDISISADNYNLLLDGKYNVAEGIAASTFEVSVDDLRKALMAVEVLFS
jgi:hypothetical protein